MVLTVEYFKRMMCLMPEYALNIDDLYEDAYPLLRHVEPRLQSDPFEELLQDFGASQYTPGIADKAQAVRARTTAVVNMQGQGPESPYFAQHVHQHTVAGAIADASVMPDPRDQLSEKRIDDREQYQKTNSTHDPVRQYLSQMADTPMLTREEELAIAKQIESVRKQRNLHRFGSTFVATHLLQAWAKVADNELPFSRTLVTNSTEELEEAEIRGRLPHNIKTIRHVLEQQKDPDTHAKKKHRILQSLVCSVMKYDQRIRLLILFVRGSFKYLSVWIHWNISYNLPVAMVMRMHLLRNLKN